MNNGGIAKYLTQNDVSFNISNSNNKKIRVGIMLNTYQLEAWDHNMLEAVIKSDYASVELVILKKIQDDKQSFLDKILENRNELGYIAYTKLENRFIRNNPDAFAPINAQKILEKIPVIEIEPRRSTLSDCFEADDVERIKKFNLDVIIQRGFRILTGDVLNAARYGVWSYHHDDNTVIRGNPPGFWETFKRMGERGATLQMVTGDVDNGVILYRSSFSCHSLFVRRNNNDCFLRSSVFVPRTLKRLSSEGENAIFDAIERENKKLTFYNDIIYTPPGNLKFLKMLLQHSYRIGAEYVNSHFFSRQWLLMYDLQDKMSTSFWRFKKIIPPRDRFWADPHVFFKDNTYYIFIEEFIYKKKKAHISVIEMQQSGNYSDPVKVLEEPFHLSYPQIFEYNKTVYMIPETQKANSINLYECTAFPTEWKHRATLMDSVVAVDSTLLFHNNKWWLFSNIAEPEGTSFNELYLFYADNLLSQKWNSHPMNPVISDVRRARSAGKIFENGGKLYRPSQCGSPYYGYGIKLNEIDILTENEYREREIAFIEPTWDKKLNGVHTFCHEDRLTMIDGDYNKFVV